MPILNDPLSIIQVLVLIEIALFDDQLFVSLLSVVTMIILMKSEPISMNTDALTLEFARINDTLLMTNVKKDIGMLIHNCCFVWCLVDRCHFFC